MKKFIIITSLTIVVLIGAVITIPSVIDWSNYKTEIASQIKKFLGRDVVISGDISLKVIPQPFLSIKKVQVLNLKNGSQDNMIDIKELEIKIDGSALLTGEIKMQKVFIKEPTILFEVTKDNKPNWEFSFIKNKNINQTKKKKKHISFNFQSTVIQNGTVIYKDINKNVEEKISHLNGEVIVESLKGPIRVDTRFDWRNNNFISAFSMGKISKTAPISTSFTLTHKKSKTLANINGNLKKDEQTKKRFFEGKLTFRGDDLKNLYHVFDKKRNFPYPLSLPINLRSDIKIKKELLGFYNAVMRYGKDQQEKTSATFNLEAKSFVEPMKEKASAQENAQDKPQKENKEKKQETTTQSEQNQKKLLVETSFKFSNLVLAPFIKAVENEIKNVKLRKTNVKIPKNLKIIADVFVNKAKYKNGFIRQSDFQIDVANGKINFGKGVLFTPGNTKINFTGKLYPSKNDWTYNLDSQLESHKFRSFINWLELFEPNGKKYAYSDFFIKSKINGTTKSVKLPKIKATLDKSKIQGALNIAFSSKKAVGFLLGIDEINLDDYLEEKPEKTNNKLSLIQKIQKENKKLKILNKLNLSGKMLVKKLVYNKNTYENIKFDGTLYDDVAKIKLFEIEKFFSSKFSIVGKVSGVGEKLVFNDSRITIETKKPKKFFDELNIKLPLIKKEKLKDFFVSLILNGDLENKTAFNIRGDSSGLNFGFSGALSIDEKNKKSLNSVLILNHMSFNDFIELFADNYRPQGGALGVFRLFSKIDIDNFEKFNFKGANLKIGLAQAKGDLVFLKNEKKPKITGNLNVNQLEIDKFLHKKRFASLNAPKIVPASSLASVLKNTLETTHPWFLRTQGFGKKLKRRPNWSKKAISSSFLDFMNMDIDLKADSISYEEKKINNANLKLNIDNKNLKISDLKAKYKNGDVTFSGEFKPEEETNSFSGNLKLDKLDFAHGLFNSGMFDIEKGILSYTTNWNTKGKSPDEMISSLNSNTDYLIQKGVFRGINLKDLSLVFEKKRTDEGLVSIVKEHMENGKTNFDEIKGNLKINKGDAKSLDIEISTPLGRANGSVTFNLESWNTDNKINFFLEKPENIPEFSWLISGNLTNPKVDFKTDQLESFFKKRKQEDIEKEKQKQAKLEQERKDKIKAIKDKIIKNQKDIKINLARAEGEAKNITDENTRNYLLAIKKDKKDNDNLISSIDKILEKEQTSQIDITKASALLEKSKNFLESSEQNKYNSIRSAKISKLEKLSNDIPPLTAEVENIVGKQRQNIIDAKQFLLGLYGEYSLPNVVDESFEKLKDYEKKIQGTDLQANTLVQASVSTDEIEKLNENKDKINELIKQAKDFNEQAKKTNLEINNIIKDTKERSKEESDRKKKLEEEIAAQKKKLEEEKRKAEEERRKAEEARKKAEEEEKRKELERKRKEFEEFGAIKNETNQSLQNIEEKEESNEESSLEKESQEDQEENNGEVLIQEDGMIIKRM